MTMAFLIEKDLQLFVDLLHGTRACREKASSHSSRIGGVGIQTRSRHTSAQTDELSAPDSIKLTGATTSCITAKRPAPNVAQQDFHGAEDSGRLRHLDYLA